MLVGDPDQAIYEWRDAKPKVFVSKEKAEGWAEALYLSENRRSSQYICAATQGFSKYLPEISMAVGDHATCEIRPKIVEYDPEEFDSLMQTFIMICRDCGIVPSPESTAILVRTNRILRKILGIKNEPPDPWNHEKHEITHVLAQGAYYYHDRHNPKQAIASIQDVLTRLCFGEEHYTRRELDQQINAVIGARMWRVGRWQLLKRLPHTTLPLSEWVIQAEGIFQNWVEENGWPMVNESKITLKVKQGVGRHKDKEFLGWPVSTFFTGVSCEREYVRVETIHAAKGKTYEAVLFVVSDSKSRKGTAKQLGEQPDGDEEIRTAYVAMTRPHKLLVVAIPKDTKREYLRRFPEWMKPNLPEQSGQLSMFA
jgi:DNA helicase-2/ATP-dependent DNA helicase PcrA